MKLDDAQPSTTLIPLAVFVAITLGTWAVLGLVAGRPEIGRGPAAGACSIRGAGPRRRARRKRQEHVPGEGDGGRRASWASRCARPTRQELGKIRLKLLNAGFRQEQAVAVFLRDQAHRALDRPGRGRSRLRSCTSG